MPDADAIMPFLSDKITAQDIENYPNRQKIIASYSVGFNHIDLEAAKREKIFVTNTPRDQRPRSLSHHRCHAGYFAPFKRNPIVPRAGRKVTGGCEGFTGRFDHRQDVGRCGHGKRSALTFAEIAQKGFDMRLSTGS